MSLCAREHRPALGEPQMRPTAKGKRIAIWALVGILIFCTLAKPILPNLLSELIFESHIAISNPQPEAGLAYTGKLSDPTLSDHEKPTRGALYSVQARNGSLLSR